MMISKLKILSYIRNSEKGFTLIELMTVVMIVVIVSSFAIPIFMRYRAKAMKTEVHSLMGSLWTQEEIYYSGTDTYSDSIADMGFNPITDPKFYENWYIHVYEDVGGISRFIATCSGNLDRDVFLDVWRLTDENRGAFNTFDDVEDVAHPIP